jgi:hypothetical protein
MTWSSMEAMSGSAVSAIVLPPGVLSAWYPKLFGETLPIGSAYCGDMRQLLLLSSIVLALAPEPARAGLYSLESSGTISSNSSTDVTIPVGTLWSFELTYDTAAPDLDFELTGTSDPTFGRYTNTGAIPALTFFHYQAGGYEVTIDDPTEFGAGSEIHITFIPTGVSAIDINLNAPALFPPLAGGAVAFHADFNSFASPPIFTSDGLPTDTTLGPDSFGQSSVTLLPPAGAITGSVPTSFTIRPVPEPAVSLLGIVGALIVLAVARKAGS